VKLRNRYGDPVDPVPAAVVAGMGTLVAWSFFPVYVTALGYSPTLGVVVAALLTLAVVAGAFYRFVWTVRPESSEAESPDGRLRRMFYAGIALAVVLFALSLPFLNL
jgi:phosphate/sulfate permease